MTRAKNRVRNAAGHHSSLVVIHVITPGVIQIPGDVTVSEAALLMHKERVPCLLIKDTESSIGIMTPSDIVYKVVAQGLNPDDVEARTIMSRPVQSIEFDRPAEDATTVMASTGVPLLIVTKESQPIGVLTACDLVLSPKRCKSRIPASLKIHDGKAHEAEQSATITQLSHLGALVETSASVPSGTGVSLNFSLPGSDRPLTAHATVLKSDDHAHRGKTGQAPLKHSVEMLFTHLSVSDQTQIKAWVIRTLSKKSGEA